MWVVVVQVGVAVWAGVRLHVRMVYKHTHVLAKDAILARAHTIRAHAQTRAR